MARKRFTERAVFLNTLRSLTNDLIALHARAQSMHETYHDSELGPSAISTMMQEILDDCQQIETDIVSHMGDYDYDYAIEVRIGDDPAYTSAAFLDSADTLTADGGTPYGVFQASDVVEIIDAEDAANKQTLTVSTATNTVLTFSGTPTLTDNTTDTRVVVVLRTR